MTFARLYAQGGPLFTYFVRREDICPYIGQYDIIICVINNLCLILTVFQKGMTGDRNMEIKSVREFKEYGRVVDGYDVSEIVKVLAEKTPLPEDVIYVADDENLQNTSQTKDLAVSLFGGMPYQFGYCNGHNTKLNCLEYHRDSEFNVGPEDFVLLLAKLSDIEDGKLDTAKAKAFKVPKGVLVEVYGSTLHYSPCHADPEKGFKVLIALPKGTNVGLPKTAGKNLDDRMLFATNKWLLAHGEAPEIKDGAYEGLFGENIDIADSI